jgi:hypothetical protein
VDAWPGKVLLMGGWQDWLGQGMILLGIMLLVAVAGMGVVLFLNAL